MVERGRTQIPVAAGSGSGPACRAPSVSMHFRMTGEVHACCQNGTFVFGDVRTDSLADIWAGVRRRTMADALAAGEYPIGCEGCAVEHALGNRASTPAASFDWFPPGDTEWPRQLEFTLSNRCNLACVQCNADTSSTIRKREGLAPLPMPYEDRFFEELVPFLEHVEVCAFLGGEPFLTPEARRVWDLLLEQERPPVVQVTTNATVWNESVERYVHELRMDLAISMDGATPATYEAIRLGARHDRVAAIRDRMVEAARGYGGRVQLNWCLMRANWHEVGLFLQQADALDVDAFIIPVWAPTEHSLFTLGREELVPVVDALRVEGPVVAPTLGRNRDVWDTTVRLIEDQLERLGSDHSRTAARDRIEEGRQATFDAVAEEGRGELAAWADRDCIEVRTTDGRVTEVLAPGWADELEPQQWVGLSLDELPALVARGRGSVEHDVPEPRVAAGDVLTVRTATTMTTAERVVRFRAIHIAGADRLLIVSPDLPTP